MAAERVKRGTKSGGSGSPFLCLLSGAPMLFDYLRTEAKAGGMGARLIAIVAEGDGGRVYLSPTPEQENIARQAKPEWKPDTDLPERALGFRVQQYGMTRWADLFTSRQLVALTTFADLIGEAIAQIRQDAVDAGLPDDGRPLREGGKGARAYAEAVAAYLAFALSKQADLGNSLCRWEPVAQCPRQLFGRQAIPMVWDYAEGNPLGSSSGSCFHLLRIQAVRNQRRYRHDKHRVGDLFGCGDPIRLRHYRHVAATHRKQKPHGWPGRQRPRLQHRPHLPPTPGGRPHRHPAEAMSYNGLVQSWPHIALLARQEPPAEQSAMFGGEREEGET